VEKSCEEPALLLARAVYGLNSLKKYGPSYKVTGLGIVAFFCQPLIKVTLIVGLIILERWLRLGNDSQLVNEKMRPPSGKDV